MANQHEPSQEPIDERAPGAQPAPRVAHPEELPISIREELPFRFVHADFLSGVAWMALTGLLFFGLPLFNGFLAGSLGGWRAKSVGRAVVGALVASALATAVLFGGFYFFRINPSYLSSGLEPWGWFLATLIGMVPTAWAAAVARQGSDEAHTPENGFPAHRPLHWPWQRRAV